jgi:hypothetical protein
MKNAYMTLLVSSTVKTVLSTWQYTFADQNFCVSDMAKCLQSH